MDEFCAERVDHATSAWLASLAAPASWPAGEAEPGDIEDADGRRAAVGEQAAASSAAHRGRDVGGARRRASVLDEPAWFPYLWEDVAKRVVDEGRAEMVAELVEGSEAAMIAADTLPGVAFRAAGTVR